MHSALGMHNDAVTFGLHSLHYVAQKALLAVNVKLKFWNKTNISISGGSDGVHSQEA